MARKLYATLPSFARIVDACAAAFDPHLPRPLLDALFGEMPADAATLAQTWLTQPVMFTIDYALGRLLLDWGVRPACLIGHSVGEYAAACLAGVMSLEDAARVVAARGRLIHELPAGGGMMAVFDSAESLAPALAAHAGRLWFGAHNGQHQVVSGQLEAIAQLQAGLQPLGKVCRPLQVSHAFHTPLLEPMLDAFDRVLDGVAFAPARIPLVSNLGGRWVAMGEALDAAYWREHVTAPVAFEQGVRVAVERGIGVFLECGPDKVLASLTRSIVGAQPVQVVPTLDRRRDDWDGLLNGLADLYRQGVDLDWEAFDADFAPRRLVLPTYPFARTPLRIATEPERGARPGAFTGFGSAPPAAASSPPAAPAPAAPVLRLGSWQEVVQDMLVELLALARARKPLAHAWWAA